jgi:hypothetical protein
MVTSMREVGVLCWVLNANRDAFLGSNREVSMPHPCYGTPYSLVQRAGAVR